MCGLRDRIRDAAGKVTTNSQGIGERVRLARIEQNLSQEGLASLMPEFTRAGKTTTRTASWVSNIEQGKNEPSIGDLSHLATTGTKEITIDPPDSPINELAEAKRELAKIPARRRTLLDRLSREIVSDDEYLSGMQIVAEDEAKYREQVETLEQQVKDADEARRALEQRPDQLRALLDPNSTPQEKKAVLQRYLQRVIVYPRDPEPRIVA